MNNFSILIAKSLMYSDDVSHRNIIILDKLETTSRQVVCNESKQYF